jgi:hypothetical protein
VREHGLQLCAKSAGARLMSMRMMRIMSNDEEDDDDDDDDDALFCSLRLMDTYYIDLVAWYL